MTRTITLTVMTIQNLYYRCLLHIKCDDKVTFSTVNSNHIEGDDVDVDDSGDVDDIDTLSEAGV